MATERTRLYLVTPRIRSANDLPAGLGEALASGDVACLLLRFEGVADRGVKEIVRDVAALVQSRGTALLVEDARLAAHSGADGVHVEDAGEPFAEALESLKPERIVGVGGALSRDEAMRVGEAGADYLMFGREGLDPEETLERVDWWAEIFNVPCVGFASSLGEVAALARAGAEFVGLGDAVFTDPRGAAEAVAEAEAVLVHAAADGLGTSA